MHPAYSVILFTSSSGAGYGLLAMLGMVAIAHGQTAHPAFGITAALISLALIGLGLLSSTLHLGRPERMWRAFSQWRTSWLSREGVLAIITFVPAILFLATWTGLVPLGDYVVPLAWASIIMAGLTVYSTGMMYYVLATIRQWRQPLTVPVYLAFALASGAVLLQAIAFLFGRGQVFQLWLTLVLVILALALKLIYWRTIDTLPVRFTPQDATGLGEPGQKVAQWEVAHTAPNFVMKEMGYAVGRRHAQALRRLVLAGFVACLSLTALGLLLPALAVGLAVLSFVVLVPAILVERWLFFAEAKHVSALYYGAESE